VPGSTIMITFVLLVWVICLYNRLGSLKDEIHAQQLRTARQEARATPSQGTAGPARKGDRALAPTDDPPPPPPARPGDSSDASGAVGGEGSPAPAQSEGQALSSAFSARASSPVSRPVGKRHARSSGEKTATSTRLGARRGECIPEGEEGSEPSHTDDVLTGGLQVVPVSQIPPGPCARSAASSPRGF